MIDHVFKSDIRGKSVEKVIKVEKAIKGYKSVSCELFFSPF